ncbi:putative methyltransferase DDB_G0268948 isoform X2 [Hemicordylus capensis]|uniref:putative methyltransferase DDB_G0268948 isoform X2 n=1 Tax=Hemicordylus capensis TaxID=884348 RepID=UPI0023041FF2|nr:putative methyltransferase DDB_G0268948 isoform X2 [Hemicordylus capensis]
MDTRLFEGREHAAFYQKYRFSPQENVQASVFSYLEKKGASFQLAVDVGCGSGQSTKMLAKRFEEVVGMDISEAQIEEAKQASHPSNISYLVCPAEEPPFEDNSVDLITAFAAAHWFNTPIFMREVDRVLKPSGCVVLCSYTTGMQLHYEDRTEKLMEIFAEMRDLIYMYADEKIKIVVNDYQEIFDSLPFPDKERINTVDKVPMSIGDLMGYIESLSPYQTFLRVQPDAAKSRLQKTAERGFRSSFQSRPDRQDKLPSWKRPQQPFRDSSQSRFRQSGQQQKPGFKHQASQGRLPGIPGGRQTSVLVPGLGRDLLGRMGSPDRDPRVQPGLVVFVVLFLCLFLYVFILLT